MTWSCPGGGTAPYFISRSSLFLNQWLVSRLGEEISPRQTFTRFKHFVEHEAGISMAELLPMLKQQAVLYQGRSERAADAHADLSRVELSVYRLQATELELLKPILIWLHEPGLEIPAEVVEPVVRVTESWILRRTLLRLSTADIGRIVADLIQTHRAVPATVLAAHVERYLSTLNAASNYWPGDAEIEKNLKEEVAYRRFKRGRLRVFLEAMEDHLRGYTGVARFSGGRVARGKYHIEHLLPRKWETHWPVDDPAAKIDRDEHVHRLGNLTLLTKALNSSVSNGPWLGTGGKRAKLREHDVFLLNKRIKDLSAEGWTEQLIDERTSILIKALLETWPVPDGHTGQIQDAENRSAVSVSLKNLIAAGHLAPGTLLKSRRGEWGDREAVVQTMATSPWTGTSSTRRPPPDDIYARVRPTAGTSGLCPTVAVSPTCALSTVAISDNIVRFWLITCGTTKSSIRRAAYA